MKLSQAIEQMLVTRRYGNQCEFMCCVLDHANLSEFVNDVQDMVASIYDSGKPTWPLACALHDAGIIDTNNQTWSETLAYTTQLYCWWVFDLKRKGL